MQGWDIPKWFIIGLALLALKSLMAVACSPQSGRGNLEAGVQPPLQHWSLLMHSLLFKNLNSLILLFDIGRKASEGKKNLKVQLSDNYDNCILGNFP